MKIRTALVSLVLCAAPQVTAASRGTGASQEAAADTILRGGHVVTLDPSVPGGTAIAIREGRILAVGSDEQVSALAGPDTQLIELKGATAIPGFIEGHAHFLGIGDAKVQLQLADARSFEEIVGRVERAVKQARDGELIRGRGWHQDKWDRAPEPSVEGLPLHHALSAVSPRNPVILVHRSGHAVLANAAAMKIAEITRETEDPDGGEIVRDEQGEPIGIFRETAAALLRRARDTAEPADPRRLALLADREVLSKGITSFQDAGSSLETVELFRDMAEKGELGVRLWVMIRDSNERLSERMAAVRTIGLGSGHLTVRAIKHSIDGALGSHGAWLLEPYADLPESTGLNTTSLETIEETARLALQYGYQLCVHSIGDRGNRETLDIFERAFANRRSKALRWRVEHAQHLHPDDIPRFVELGVIASMQGIHCTSDAPFVVPRLGEVRASQGAYVWKTLQRSGAVVTNGTDAPVEDVDPIAGYHATVTRRTASGDSFYPEQALGREDALRTYTINCAYAAFEEDVKGTLTPGKYADITVLSRNILEVPDEELLDTRVLYTIVGGEVLYRAE